MGIQFFGKLRQDAPCVPGDVEGTPILVGHSSSLTERQRMKHHTRHPWVLVMGLV